MDISPATSSGFQVNAGSGIPLGQTASGPVAVNTAAAPQRTDDAQSRLPQQAAAAPSTNLKSAVADLQQQLRAVAPDLEFSIDQDTGRTLIKVVDTSTQEVLRQIPSEEVLKMDKAISGYLGLLMDKHA